MISLRKPTAPSLRRFLEEQSRQGFSYEDVGATSRTPPNGYDLDHVRVTLGEGEIVYRDAVAAMRRWDQFRIGWIEVWPPDVPLVQGQSVAVIARTMGLYWINACRIIQVIDESDLHARFGFTYGTLPDHVESGEERFWIDWDHSDNSVSYDILAVSQPNGLMAKLGYPIARRTQKRFGRDSAEAMRIAVRNSVHRMADQASLL